MLDEGRDQAELLLVGELPRELAGEERRGPGEEFERRQRQSLPFVLRFHDVLLQELLDQKWRFIGQRASNVMFRHSHHSCTLTEKPVSSRASASVRRSDAVSDPGSDWTSKSGVFATKVSA